jgi:hypothetical protein
MRCMHVVRAHHEVLLQSRARLQALLLLEQRDASVSGTAAAADGGLLLRRVKHLGGEAAHKVAARR